MVVVQTKREEKEERETPSSFTRLTHTKWIW